MNTYQVVFKDTRITTNPITVNADDEEGAVLRALLRLQEPLTMAQRIDKKEASYDIAQQN